MLYHEPIALKGATPGATLVPYVSDVTYPIRDAILVIPGGGYKAVCSDREGEPIALAFLARGMNAFVLHYTVTPKDPYAPLVDASAAMHHIRENAEKYFINPERVFAVGFSAGGHLTATLGTMWNDETLLSKIHIPCGANRPTGMILCYPVIDDHLGSFMNLLGDKSEDLSLREHFMVSKRVDANTSPAFIIHTATDEVVPIANSLRIAEALSNHGIMYEMHIYPFGPHGMALANSDTSMGREDLIDPAYARWVDDVMVWMKRI